MGKHFIIAAALAAGLLTPVAARAQQEGGSVQDFRLDPARDPSRPQPPERSGPELDAALTPPPPVVTPPVVAPTVPPPVETMPPPTPSTTSPARRPVTPNRAPASAPTMSPTNVAPAESSTPPAGDVVPLPAEPVTTPPPVAESDAQADVPATLWWPWALGAALIAGVAFALWRRRTRPTYDEATDEIVEAYVAPEPPVPLAPPVAEPAVPPPAAVPAVKNRPWITIAFQPQSARSSLVGASIGYRLTLRNMGSAAAQDVRIAAMIANADARQPAALAAFFAASDSPAIHSIASIAPGEAVELTGELRLGHDAIVPIRVKDRALLIPVVAFDALYGWADTAQDQAPGRTGASFIVGQESDPPRDKMAPFRLDLGPRQYRQVGSRPAQRVQVA